MVEIDTSVLDGWEDPAMLESASATVKAAAEGLDGTFGDLRDEWQAVDAYYEGEHKHEILTATDSPKQQTEDLRNAATEVDDAIWEFAVTLGQLVTSREQVCRDAASFTRAYGGLREDQLQEHGQLENYYSLLATVSGLTIAYDRAVDTCVARLNGIGSAAYDAATRMNGVLSAWSSAQGQLWQGLAMGVPMNVKRMTVTGTDKDSRPIPPAQQRRTMFFNQDVTGFVHAMGVLRDRSIAALDTVDVRRARNSWKVVPHLVRAMGSPHLAPAAWLEGLHRTATASVRALSAPESPVRHGLGAAMNAARHGATLPVDVQMRLLKEGKRDHVKRSGRADELRGKEREDIKERRDIKEATGRFKQRFKQELPRHLPLLGDVLGEMDAREIVKAEGIHAKETQSSLRPGTALRSGNALLTVAGGVLTYEDEKAREREEVRRENPHLSASEAEREAKGRARAQTLGNVGSTAVVSGVAGAAASGAAGAAFGSAVPVAGTAVGFVVGLGAGYVMNHKWLDDADGDGEKDSAAERVGDAVEAIREDPGKAARDFGNGVKDGAKGAVDTVAGWFGG